ncbi:GNAT family N-acetyltransferase [Arthrobacter mobilis]|uniref:GNAT family N-acetyltransferase n=1 Tax=Arthrobacter mobilis TaxID=2724944 RepID=A0A7X6HGB6_9MICC|nr:GNAT family N-acetyltransferase [Arthrobacter mobilis]NKX55638.1 GNAT family N-acetyltransferase [Arthrobacter mobilis]
MPPHRRAGPEPAAEVVAITAETWPLFEELLGPGGLQGGCWCSWFRLSSKEYGAATSAGRKAFVHGRVLDGEPFGLVAVVEGMPAAWVSVAPRACHARLLRSPIARLPEGEEEGVWSVACFYVAAKARGRHLTGQLLEAAAAYAAGHGARVLEGYPVDPGGERMAPAGLYHGTLAMFLQAGFELVERRGVRRALVRRQLPPGPGRD